MLLSQTGRGRGMQLDTTDGACLSLGEKDSKSMRFLNCQRFCVTVVLSQTKLPKMPMKNESGLEYYWRY